MRIDILLTPELMHTKRSIPVLIASFILSACLQLTPAGAHVQIITEDQQMLVAACKSLGKVFVSSEDALRNASAALSGDTAVISRRDVGSTTIVRGDVYRCSVGDKKVEPEPTTTEKENAEYIRKSNICQTKGGVWIASQCVITIE